MKVLSDKEFKELAIRQKFSSPDSLAGFINMETYEATVPTKASTRVKLHELGHEELEHLPKAIKFYSKGRKDVYRITHPWRQSVDDEIEAEIYSYRLMGKKLTPRVGLSVLRGMIDKGWEPHRALGLVIGRLKHYGIKTTWKDRLGIARTIEGARGVTIKGLEGGT